MTSPVWQESSRKRSVSLPPLEVIIINSTPSSSNAKEKPKSNFFEQAKFWLNQTNPDWKEKLNAKFGQMETICIPDCLDIRSLKCIQPLDPKASGFDNVEAEKSKRRVKGIAAEEQFFLEFRKLKLGGILIGGFDSQPFVKVMDIIGVRFKKEITRHFECDFIFIHQRVGIIAIEVKGNEDDNYAQFAKATKQLEKITGGLKKIFMKLAREHDSHSSFQVQGVVCMPYFEMDSTIIASRASGLNIRRVPSDLIDKRLLYETNDSIQYWKSREKSKFALTDDMIRFITAIIAYRPARFISAATNALEIYRLIDQQNFTNTKKDVSQAIFFNKDQLNVVETSKQRVAIIGPPGTGKTLCLLQRVLNAAEIEKPGRVVVALLWRMKELIALFEIFFENNSSKLKRIPQITRIKDDNDLSYFTPEDDVFTDEMSLTENGNFLKTIVERELLLGSSTIVITGSFNPRNIIDKESFLSAFRDFEKFELRTVVRGTKTIINEWQVHFPEEYLHVGHNITGAPIQRYSVESFSEITEIVCSVIKEHLMPIPQTEAKSNQRGKTEQNRPLQCTPNDIAILVVSQTYLGNTNAIEIRKKLEERRIMCGPIQQQARDLSLIAVDYAINALSYEWPIVIVIAFDRSKEEEEWYKNCSGYLIALSRAVAKLIVIDSAPRNSSHLDEHLMVPSPSQLFLRPLYSDPSDHQIASRPPKSITSEQDSDGQQEGTSSIIGIIRRRRSNDGGSHVVHENEHGINWWVTGLFIVGEMAGVGLIGMPKAMVNADLIGGLIVLLLAAVFSCYTGIQLGDNWTMLRERWPAEYLSYCRKPYRAMGDRAIGWGFKLLVSICLEVTQFVTAVALLLIASNNIHNLLKSFFEVNLSFCVLILIVAICLLPITMLKSPKDLWPAAIMAMVTTSVAVILICVGSLEDRATCEPVAEFPPIQFKTFFLAFGTIMLAYGGHSAFPTIQHDMKKPYQFNRSVILAYIIIICMYVPVSVLGYLTYGDSLGDSIIPSLQIKWIQQTANVLISVHLILIVTIFLNPLNQELEELLKLPQNFGWKRVVARTGIMAVVVFVAETAPFFDVMLNLVGGSTVTLMTMVFPGICNLYLVVAKEKANGEINTDHRATLREVFVKTPKPKLILNVVVILFGIIGGFASTWSAIEVMVGATFPVPCYVAPFLNQAYGQDSIDHTNCCGHFHNISRYHNFTEYCQ